MSVFLNGQNKPLGEKEITEGTPAQATVYVRRVIEEALHLSAAAVVLVHNHPSGSPQPSAGDDDTTGDLLKACRLVQLILLDHVIVGEDIRNFPLPLPPVDIQRRITERVSNDRAWIARERATAHALARQIEADMEAYLLGTKKVGVP